MLDVANQVVQKATEVQLIDQNVIVLGLSSRVNAELRSLLCQEVSCRFIQLQESVLLFRFQLPHIQYLPKNFFDDLLLWIYTDLRKI